ncbi:MAG: 2Fe-2S iron-sulfur cluster binding domain-containing protein [Planctomycetota bacterium]|nr:2Fe-2S iron-sulfur cluster binding domain-containing protein [Planctomycetota bacterium]
MDQQLHKITLKKSGQTGQIPHGENILEFVDFKMGRFINSLCRGGSCGTCKVQLISGDVDCDMTKAYTAEDRAAGVILACASRAMGDIVLDV